MPQISNKGKLMPASPIRKLTPYAEQAKRQGKKVYHLNIGQPDIETPGVVLDAIKNIDFKVWAYTQSEGTLSYRKKLVEYYNRNNYNVTVDSSKDGFTYDNLGTLNLTGTGAVFDSIVLDTSKLGETDVKHVTFNIPKAIAYYIQFKMYDISATSVVNIRNFETLSIPRHVRE